MTNDRYGTEPFLWRPCRAWHLGHSSPRAALRLPWAGILAPFGAEAISWLSISVTKSSTPSPPATSPRSTAPGTGNWGAKWRSSRSTSSSSATPGSWNATGRRPRLLASLQHPNILTIYDVVRPRGWLILELMRGNLQTMTRGEPDRSGLSSARCSSASASGFAVSPCQRHDARRRQAQQPAGRCAEPGQAGRFRPGAPGQQPGGQPAERDHQVHGPRAGLQPVWPLRSRPATSIRWASRPTS